MTKQVNDRQMKPELLVTVRDLEELRSLAGAGADAFSIGDPYFGVRTPGDWTLETVTEAILIAHKLAKKVYISMNLLIHDTDLERLPEHMRVWTEAGADGIMFGDPAVYMVAKEIGSLVPLHWSGEMTTTNYQAINYWGKRGVSRSVLARELNLEQLQSMREHTPMELQVHIHGATCIYHSKRSLLSNYKSHLNRDELGQIGLDAKVFHVIERERLDETFPLFEDKHGTHMFSSEDFCYLDVLNEVLPLGIDSLKIEGLLMERMRLEASVRAYRKAIDWWTEGTLDGNMKELERMKDELLALQPEGRPFGYGFLFKEQVY